MCRYYIGQQAYVLITDLDILKQILVKDFDNFSDHAVRSTNKTTQLHTCSTSSVHKYYSYCNNCPLLGHPQVNYGNSV